MKFQQLDMLQILIIILSVNNYFSGKVNFVEIPRSRGLDIDDKFDLNLARKLFK